MSPLKRLLDLVGSVAGLILLSPLLLLVAMVVRARLGTPVLFVQERPGQREPRCGRTLSSFRASAASPPSALARTASCSASRSPRSAR
jgi:lipopolysaccharide/colanic/teichoic acid biosynthesis glycosyltransferase